MLKVEAIIQPFKLDDVKAALANLGIEGVTILHVLDHGGAGGLKAVYRGGEYQIDLPKVKLEMVVSAHRADEVVDAISRAARTGMSGDDGTVLVYEIADAIRIRNGRRMELALSE
ncbi:MAG: nitrogen regulatory protein [Bryobacterales bacterium]|nr:nitrogen regulatory protein [Bryobacterales bacterium]